MTPSGRAIEYRRTANQRNQTQMENATIETIAEQFAEGNYDHYTDDLSLRTTEKENGSGVIYSYGAIIATRFEDGHIVVYDGWEGYSPLTDAHIDALQGCFEGLDVKYEINAGRFGVEAKVSA